MDGMCQHAPAPSLRFRRTPLSFRHLHLEMHHPATKTARIQTDPPRGHPFMFVTRAPALIEDADQYL